MSKMLRNYQYLVGNNPHRNYESETLKEYIEGEVSSAVTSLVNLAPEELDSLGELANAIQNDPDFLTTLQGKDTALLAAIGIAANEQNIGELTTVELPDNETVKALFEAVGEAARRLREGLGVAQGSSDLGTFTGTVITDNSSVKTALQELETFSEANSAAGVQNYVDQQIATDMWLFADQAAFPAAASNHGRVVHSHADGAMFYAHGGMWHKLQTDTVADGDEAALQAAIDAAVLRIDALEVDPTTATAVAAVQADVDANEVATTAAAAALDLRVAALEVDPTTAAAVAAVQADVDQNEADADAAIALKANIDSATLTGTPAAPTAAAGTNTTQIATTAFVATAVGDLIDGAPGAINTLNELSAALGDDANFATTVTNSIAAVQSDVDQNELDSDAAELALSNRLDALDDLGTFTGSVIGDNVNVKTALQSLETSFEAFDSAQGIVDILDGTSNFTGFKLRGTSVIVDGQELNYVNGVTSSIQTQLNTLTAGVAAVQADVDQNESDADAAIAAVQADVDQNEADADAAIALKADIASPTFTGTPAAPTASAGTNTTQIATTAFVSAAVAATIDSAPGALDTLNELAAALGDDANFSTTITNSIAAVQADVDQNELDADNAIAAVQADVDQNEADADAAIALKLDASAVSTFGGTLVDDADAAAARTTLGLGTAATTAAADYATAAQGALADSALQAADIAGKADLASPALTGTPTAPTAAADTNTTQVATTAYVQQELTDLINGAPAGLDTLKELADALESDTQAIQNVTTLINANEAHVDNLVTLSGVAKDAVNLGAFSGATISDNGTVKAGMQELETAIEAGITLASFKAVVAASADFADFQTRVAAL